MKNRKKKWNFDKNSFEWLAENYIRKNGLRNFTWRTIFEGIRKEHILEIKLKGELLTVSKGPFQ